MIKVLDQARAAETGGSAGRRVSLVTLDQALSSASNLFAILVVAHVLQPADFGRFGILFVVYTVAQSLSRALVSVSVVVHPADADERPGVALGATLLLGGSAGIICGCFGVLMWLLGDALAPSMLVLAVCLAPLLLQDVGRYLAFARARPRQAIVLDTLWLVLMAGGFVASAWYANWTLLSVVSIWAVAGSIAAAWVLVQYGIPSRRDIGLSWLRQRWDFAWRNFIGNFASQVFGLIGVAVAALVSSPTAVAALRGSVLLGRPSAALHAGVATSSAADVAREQPDDAGLRTHQRRAMAICVGVSILNLATLLVLPDVLGRALLGGVWSVMKPLVLPVGLLNVAAAFQIGVGAVLVGRREMRFVMPASIITAGLGVCCMTPGAIFGGAAGILWGTLVGQSLATGVWWIFYIRYLRGRSQPAGRHRAMRVARTGSLVDAAAET